MLFAAYGVSMMDAMMPGDLLGKHHARMADMAEATVGGTLDTDRLSQHESCDDCHSSPPMTATHCCHVGLQQLPTDGYYISTSENFAGQQAMGSMLPVSGWAAQDSDAQGNPVAAVCRAHQAAGAIAQSGQSPASSMSATAMQPVPVATN